MKVSISALVGIAGAQPTRVTTIAAAADPRITAANGAIGDLAPHIINCALAFLGPMREVMAAIETVHPIRPNDNGPEPVTNDDHVQIMCRFESGVMGHLYVSRIATGRKMGYSYEIHGTKGALRFDQEDQNALWLYQAAGPESTRGFTKVLAGPSHPDYRAFCQGPGHGTGYQDQIIIEARDFLTAIDAGKPVWPTFRDGMEVNRIIAAAIASALDRRWTTISSL